MNLWTAIIGMGVITYAIRLVPIWLLERASISDGWRQALRFVPAAVLSAIILPELLMPGGVLDLSLGMRDCWQACWPLLWPGAPATFCGRWVWAWLLCGCCRHGWLRSH